MANKVLVAYIVADFLFVIAGALMLGFSVIVQNIVDTTPTTGTDAVIILLYSKFPLTAGIANAVFYFVTFLFTLPVLTMPASGGWLKLSGYMIVVTALFSLVIGLDLWIITLNTKEQLATLWSQQTSTVQELMQTSFACCGFYNSSSPAFVTDATCPSPAAAALVRGCAAPVSSFANVFIDDIFTAVFGMCGVCAVLMLATSCLHKDRKERERFRYIDQKQGGIRTF